MKRILQTEIDTAHDAGQALSEEVSQHNYYISSHFFFCHRDSHWVVQKLEHCDIEKPARAWGVLCSVPPLCVPGKFPNLLPWDAVFPPHRRLPPECPSWVVSVSSAMFRFLDFMQYKRLQEKKGNSYSEFSTPLTSPPTGDANSYKLITYKTLQYVQ